MMFDYRIERLSPAKEGAIALQEWLFWDDEAGDAIAPCKSKSLIFWEAFNNSTPTTLPSVS